MDDLPRSQQIKSRPVWNRYLRRTLLNLEAMDAPTEEEKYDAIQVLRDPGNASVYGLWIEAHRILDEATD